MKNRISLFICFILPAMGWGQAFISGYVNLPDGWDPQIYLSAVYDYRKADEITRDQIIAKCPVDSTGYFEFGNGVLTDKDLIYRLHIATSEAENEYFYADFGEGQMGYNFAVFIANTQYPVRFKRATNGRAFGPVLSDNADANTWQELIQIFGAHQSTLTEQGQVAEHHFIKNYHNQLRSCVAEKGGVAQLLACSYLIEEDADFTSEYLADFKENRSFFESVLQKLDTSHPFYTNRLKKELAAVEVQLKGDQLTAVKQKLQWMYGLSIFLGLLAALFFVLWIRAKRNSTTGIESDLTAQEQKIEDLIVSGLSNKEIGDELFISLSTVKTHINTLYKKRGVRSRQELINKKSTGV